MWRSSVVTKNLNNVKFFKYLNNHESREEIEVNLSYFTNLIAKIMEFFVPFNMIEFFNQKSGKTTGNFRYVLSQRIYLFLLHKNSGRIHTKDLIELVKFFSSSKQNIEKALAKLVEMQLITVKGDYYVAYGKRKFSKRTESTYVRLYKFTEESLKNPKQFKTLVFKYIGQEVAHLKGKKFSNGLIVRQKKESKQYFVINSIRDNAEAGTYTSNQSDSLYNDHLLKLETFNPTVTDITHNQSLSYLAKANDRSSRTISRKLSNAKFTNEVAVFNKGTKNVSNCFLEHHSLDSDDLASRVWINILESEYHHEAKEMLENFKRRFPILSTDTFVAPVSNGFCVYKRATNRVSYNRVDSNTKTINKGNPNWLKVKG